MEKICKQEKYTDRKKVIEYLKDKEFNLTENRMEDIEVHAKGVTLIDQKGRKIVAYYNPLLDSIETIYDKLKLTEDEVIYEIKEGLWEDYLVLAEDIKETVVIHRPNKGEFQFLRCETNENRLINETHRSPIFKDNDLYDIHEYLLSQIQEMNSKKTERKK